MTYLAKIPLVRSGKTVLVVEDNPHLRFGMVAALRAAGHDVAEGDTCAALRERFLQSRPDAVVTDLRLPDGDAMDLLPSLRRLDPTIPLIVVTGFGTIDIAVTAVKSGAEDFLTKPVDMAKLVSLVDQVIARRTTSRSSKLLLGARPTPSASPLMRSLEDQVERLRDADCSVLILGETGTGKSVLARRIHEIGSRGSGPFIDVNCAGLTPELVENELFGHGRGAYTGAHAEKVGLFDAANRGTLFLDEIGDVDPMVQPKILKVLEEKRFRRMGEVKEREVDVRLVAATHKPLLAAVEEKQFRADLYYRISTVTLAVPALINSRHQAQLTACRNNLRTVGRAIGDYADIHRGRMPVGEPGSPFETVGAYAPILAAESLIRDDDLICPSSSFKNEVGTFRIPTAEQLIRMKPDALAYMQRVMGGSYGFTLGYAIDGAVQELKREGNPFRVVMADRPEGGDLAVAHGNGMNVLFDDGHCAFLHLDSPSLLDPQLFVNRIGAVAPGLDQDDSVIAPSHVRRVWPVRLQD